MTTDPLDVESLLEEGAASRPAWRGLPDGTVIGHVHLRVAHIVPAERFYCDLLGFDLTTRYGTMASFVSAGGYHHHVAFNTWAGVGAPPPPDEASGLREFVVQLPDADEVERVLSLVRAAGVPVARGAIVRDPSGNAVRLAAR
jgi:catechol 2,3-dioxygenase